MARPKLNWQPVKSIIQVPFEKKTKENQRYYTEIVRKLSEIVGKRAKFRVPEFALEIMWGCHSSVRDIYQLTMGKDLKWNDALRLDTKVLPLPEPQIQEYAGPTSDYMAMWQSNVGIARYIELPSSK